MEAYHGHIEAGRVVPLGAPLLPDGRRAIVTILDEPTAIASLAQRQLEALDRFRRAMRETGPLPKAFDEVIQQRVNIARECDV